MILLLACRYPPPISQEPADSTIVGDSAADTAVEDAVRYTLETVAGGEFPGLTEVKAARVNPSNGSTYVLDEPATQVRYMLETYVVPDAEQCVGGTEDENGNCRGGGVVWTSGLITSQTATAAMCLDAAHSQFYFLKAGGQTLELVDVAMEGVEPYTYNRAFRTTPLPDELAVSGKWVGPCDVLPDGDSLLVTSPDLQAVARITAGDTPSLVQQRLLQFTPAGMTVAGDRAFLHDSTNDRIVSMQLSDLSTTFWQADDPIKAMAVDRSTGDVWVALGESGIRRVRFDASGNTDETAIPVPGEVRHVVTDSARGLAWAAWQDEGAWSVALVQADGVRGSSAIAGEVLGMAEPSATGDVPVFTKTEGVVSYTVFAPVPEVVGLPPLKVFLFTTIEEPSDANMDLPCTGSGDTFENELAHVRNNAAALAGFGVPVAMAITDNFAEKAEECGVTGIYQELADYGFELGVMLHNRPCYNCTNGSHSSNPDYCNANDANHIAATNTTACFPDDPDYCAIGDWECYRTFLEPRVDIADRYIPGGGRFIVGGDRHGMWSYDWIRLYREATRASQGLTGFDLAMFAGAWAYNGVAFDDPRGKNPAPWHVDRRTPAWHLSDIDNWDQDSPDSNLVYLSGVNSATVKLAEQQATGLYMLDFFEVASEVAYRPDDFEMQWQLLRSAVANRQEAATNTWYFHIHDTGTLNIRETDGDAVTVDPDGDEGPEAAMAVEQMIEAFVLRINERYVPTGEVEWALPSEIRAGVE